MIFIDIGNLYIITMFVGMLFDFWTEPKQSEPKGERIANIVTPRLGNIPNMSANAQTVQRVRVDSEMMLARTLIDMRKGNLPIRMTEKFWLVDKPDGKENRWQKIGGSGRNDFVEMLDDRWMPYGAIEKVGGQGKRVVGDWRKLRNIEQGYKPPLPQ